MPPFMPPDASFMQGRLMMTPPGPRGWRNMPITKLAPMSLAMFYGADSGFCERLQRARDAEKPIEPEPLRRRADKVMERYLYFSVLSPGGRQL